LRRIKSLWRKTHAARKNNIPAEKMIDERTIAEEKKKLKQKFEDLVSDQENIHEKIEQEKIMTESDRKTLRRLKKFASNSDFVDIRRKKMQIGAI
jgi:hypothetical protein